MSHKSAEPSHPPPPVAYPKLFYLAGQAGGSVGLMAVPVQAWATLARDAVRLDVGRQKLDGPRRRT